MQKSVSFQESPMIIRELPRRQLPGAKASDIQYITTGAKVGQ